MSNPKIRFSHEYPKLHGQTSAELLHVKSIHSSNLHRDLVEFDTFWIRKNKEGLIEESGYYALPHGELIQLLFLGNKGIPFCTIRRHTPTKLEYYKAFIGQDFEIEIGE